MLLITLFLLNFKKNINQNGKYSKHQGLKCKVKFQHIFI